MEVVEQRRNIMKEKARRMVTNLEKGRRERYRVVNLALVTAQRYSPDYIGLSSVSLTSLSEMRTRCSLWNLLGRLHGCVIVLLLLNLIIVHE